MGLQRSNMEQSFNDTKETIHVWYISCFPACCSNVNMKKHNIAFMIYYIYTKCLTKNSQMT